MFHKVMPFLTSVASGEQVVHEYSEIWIGHDDDEDRDKYAFLPGYEFVDGYMMSCGQERTYARECKVCKHVPASSSKRQRLR